MLAGFETRRITVPGDVGIHVRVGGDGPPVLLLHGYPQTHVCWHLVAPQLVEAGFTVVCPDLRGYGDSDKPESGPDHAPYSKRAMAADQVAVMRALGFDRFHLAGHDRGGRVAHRLALDHPQAVRSVAVLDIAPTQTMYARTDRRFATGYYHWFFLIQPAPLPERLIGADPEFYLRQKIAAWNRTGMEVFAPEALAEYIRCFCDPDAIAASCEDYRAAATIDLDHDAADAEARISAPLLALWGERGLVGQLYDVLETWREKAVDVRGTGLPCGHFLPEEVPDATAAALIAHASTSA
ncbi:MAG: alpha/beta hydrolase [Rhodobacteraceae bacterium]|nr:alpha/beta hydrolase [Paracoccaceae bacterium]